MEYKGQTSLLIQRNGDGTFLVAIGAKTFEGTKISVNMKIRDVYICGFDNPEMFEVYENILMDVDINVEPDESISIEIEMY